MIEMKSLSFKRPLAAAGIPFLAGAFLGAWNLLLPLAIGVLLCLLSLKNRRRLFFLVCAILGMLYTGIYALSRPIDSDALNGQTVVLRGTVTDTRTYRTGSRFVLQNTSVNGDDRSAAVLVSVWFETEIADGDTVELRAKCTDASGAFFDADRYYYERGIDLTVSAEEILYHKPAQERPLSHTMRLWRESISDMLYDLFSVENAAFLQGMLLGVDDDLDLKTLDVLTRSGARHLFVVSGLHVTLAVSLLYAFCRKLKLPVHLCAILALFSALGIVLLTGCGIPAVRAGIMTSAVYGGRLFFRRADSANSLFGAAILIALFAPYSITSASFLLSFCASFGVYVLPPVLQKVLAERFPKLQNASSSGRSIIATFSGTLAVFPVSALLLGGFSLLSPLTTLVVSFLMQPLLFTGILALLGIPAVSDFAAYLCEGLLLMMRGMFSCFAAVPFSYMGTDSPYFVIWLILACAVCGAMFLYKRRAWPVLCTAAALFLLLPVSIGAVKLCERPVLIASAASAGSADLVLLEHEGNADLIVTEYRAGWEDNVLSLLRKRNISSLRSLILLTKDSESVSAPAFLAETFGVQTVLLYEENPLYHHADALLGEANVVLLPENGRRILYPGVDIRRSGDGITLIAANGKEELIFSNKVPQKAAVWLLFSNQWEDLYLDAAQRAVILSVPDNLEIRGGKLYNAQNGVVTAYLHSNGNVSIQK